MAYTIEFLKTAEEELAGLPKEAQRFLRLRVGDYRVIYVVEGKHLVVLVVSIGARKEVYEGLEVLARRLKVWRQSKP